MSNIATINIQQIVTGNTFDVITITLDDGATPVAVPYDLTGAEITWTLRGQKNSAVLLEKGNHGTLTGVTITNAVGGQFRIDQINNFTLPEGQYLSDILIVFADDTRRTWLRLNIDITYKLTK
jgi:hypothetical protein